MAAQLFHECNRNLAGGIFAVGIFIKKRSEARGSLLPYGVFLALGGLVVLYFGREILDWAGDNLIA